MHWLLTDPFLLASVLVRKHVPACPVELHFVVRYPCAP